MTGCESNFENLFDNWPKWVTNHQETELVSYHYVEILNDSHQIDRYAKKMNGWESLISRKSGKHGERGNSDTTIYTMKLYFHAEPWEDVIKEMPLDSLQKISYKSEVENRSKIMRDVFKDKVHIGDKVFLVKLEIEDKKYDHYVICSSVENKVVYDNLFFGIEEKKDALDRMCRRSDMRIFKERLF
ncbi:hypothetical protein [Echinicola salinicaeni]|uniref:hypothetical protein n=1 Tax=Echinicola salinicaeni TaxID=2762757 RepID=UPI0016478146|nr:hypothetical protein [Echinicola salinicaeni]